MVWTRLVAGGSLVIAVVAAVLKSGDAILAGHWAYLLWVVVAALSGLMLIWRGLRGSRPKPGGVRTVLRWAAAALGFGFAAITYWLAPYQVQVPDRSALTDPPGVIVSDDQTSIQLQPTGQPRSTGVAFIPGALVDPRAYIPILTPLVEAGHPVFIAKPPLGIAFLAPSLLPRARIANPQVTDWVVAGHSLGGAVGSQQADQDAAAGLILLGSYPINDLSGSVLKVLSISGSNDALTTPADVAGSRDDLPPNATFVVIDGGIHAYFGDYGEQAGDGTAEVSREQAQAETIEAMLAFLDHDFSRPSA